MPLFVDTGTVTLSLSGYTSLMVRVNLTRLHLSRLLTEGKKNDGTRQFLEKELGNQIRISQPGYS